MLPDLRFVIGAVLATAVLGVTAFGLATSVRLAHQAKVSPLETSRSIAFADRADWNKLAETEAGRLREEAAPALPAAAPFAAPTETTTVATAPAAPLDIQTPEHAQADIGPPRAAAIPETAVVAEAPARSLPQVTAAVEAPAVQAPTAPAAETPAIAEAAAVTTGSITPGAPAPAQPAESGQAAPEQAVPEPTVRVAAVEPAGPEPEAATAPPATRVVKKRPHVRKFARPGKRLVRKRLARTKFVARRSVRRSGVLPATASTGYAVPVFRSARWINRN